MWKNLPRMLLLPLPHSYRTVINLNLTQETLLAHFGSDTDLTEIDAVGAEEWQRVLSSRYAPATLSAHTKRAKPFFRAAVKEKLLLTSPFADLVAGDDTNPERRQYVTREETEALLEVAPDAEWRLLIALARYAGLRTPSETLRFKWADVDWQGGAMRMSPSKRRSKAGRIAWCRSSPSFCLT